MALDKQTVAVGLKGFLITMVSYTPRAASS